MVTARKMPAWSFSSLTAYETCPRQYLHTRVLKSVVEPQGEAAALGEKMHKQLEERALGRAPLPALTQHLESIVAQIVARPGKLLVEQQLAITAGLEPCDWWDKAAWCRGIVDIGVVGHSRGFMGDWKTGKRKPGSTQLMLFAALGMQHYPELERVTSTFIWTQSGKLDTEMFTRKQLPDIWGEFMPRVYRMGLAFEHDRWPARPSGLCRKWCAVRVCEFNGQR